MQHLRLKYTQACSIFAQLAGEWDRSRWLFWSWHAQQLKIQHKIPSINAANISCTSQLDVNCVEVQSKNQEHRGSTWIYQTKLPFGVTLGNVAISLWDLSHRYNFICLVAKQELVLPTATESIWQPGSHQYRNFLRWQNPTSFENTIYE